ncbi:hypothetical protein [Tropicibacter oceani]|uniref:Uncharacterized protein n=1 Tax=Tropicibacter oceani TaxID=3058420 RepID=A0ABY8QIF7_9RHOB|nr:hypothetical protein [Tropicibacter oceani]WGW03582.1 hypothetical protein QF118_16910 [Tropicibacter oceani]
MTALRVLIAMDFGCRNFDDRDFDKCMELLPENAFKVKWQGGLKSKAERLKFVFAWDAGDVRSGSEANSTSGRTPGATDFDADATQETASNHDHPLTKAAAETIVTAHQTVDAELWVKSDVVGDHVRPRQRRLVPNLKEKTTKQLISEVTKRIVSRTSKSHKGGKTIWIRFHLTDYFIRDTQQNGITSTLTDLAQATSSDDPLDLTFVFIWPENPELTIKLSRGSLTEHVDRLIEAFGNADIAIKHPVPFVLATGQLGLAASLIGNVGSQNHILDLTIGETERPERRHPATFHDPIKFLYSPEYIEDHIEQFINRDGLAQTIAAARRRNLDFRLVPFDINGVDKSTKAVASIFLPAEVQMQGSSGELSLGLGELRSSLFDEVARALYRIRHPEHDFWNNAANKWAPVRTSTILAAALAPRKKQDEATTKMHTYWTG